MIRLVICFAGGYLVSGVGMDFGLAVDLAVERFEDPN